MQDNRVWIAVERVLPELYIGLIPPYVAYNSYVYRHTYHIRAMFRRELLFYWASTESKVA